MSGRVHVVLADRGRILERIGTELAERLAYVSAGDALDPESDLNYYVNHAAWPGRGPTSEIAYFAPAQEGVAGGADRLFEVASRVDERVCPSREQADRLREHGLDSVHVIRPGVDLEELTPRLRLGLVGRTYHTGRKGEALVQSIAHVPFVEWHATGEGWPVEHRLHDAEEMAEFYRSIDYLLVPARYEGGPMPALEAMACGKPVISPEIGFMPELPHVSYENGNREDLLRVLRELHERQLEIREAVIDTTWDRFAEQHEALFRARIPALASTASHFVSAGLPGAHPAPAESDARASARANGSGTGAPPAATPGAARRDGGTAQRRALRILLANRAREYRGGPAYRVPRTAEALRERGHHVDVTGEERPDARGYDIVHVFNLWPPEAVCRQMDHLKGQGAALVFSPVFMDLRELFVAQSILGPTFDPSFSPVLRRKVMATLRAELAEAVGPMRAAGTHPLRGYAEGVRHAVSLADWIVGLGESELAGLEELCGELPPSSLVHNAPVADDRRAGALPDGFAAGGYVLVPARIEPRKNQLLLIEALRGSGIPLVLAGEQNDPEYADRCRDAAAGEPVRFLPHQSHEDGAYPTLVAGAAALVLPSWTEGAPIAALEAGQTGTRLVLSDRGAVREYFGDHAEYVQPDDPASIREGVLRAWNAFQAARGPDRELAEHVRSRFTFERVAEETEAAYRACLEHVATRGPRAAAGEVLLATLPPFPSPVPDPAPGRWTRRVRQLWPSWLDGGLDAERILELGRLWLTLRQPGAVRELLASLPESECPHVERLRRELASFLVEETATAEREPFAEALGRLEEIEATLPVNERFHLWCALAGLGAPSVVVELGSREGAATVLLAEFLERRGEDALLATVDESRLDRFDETLAAAGAADRVHPVLGRPVDVAILLERLGAAGTVDALFVQSDLRFERVREELSAWLPLLRPGGVLAVRHHLAVADTELLQRYGTAVGVRAATTELLGGRSDFRELFFPLFRSRESVFPGYPSLFSSVAVFRHAGVPRGDAKQRRVRFAQALAGIQKERGDLRGTLKAVRASAADPALVGRIDATVRGLEARAAEQAAASDRPPARAVRPATSSRIPPAVAPLGIAWFASALAYNGYAWLARRALAALADRGASVYLRSYGEDVRFLADLAREPATARFLAQCKERPVRPDLMTVLHPPVLNDGTDLYARVRQDHPDFAAYVGITMFETDRIPSSWVQAFAGMDEIWVPSEFNRRTFAECGADPDRLHVVPFGIDASAYGREAVAPLDLPDRAGFTFLSVFQWYFRKGWDVLLRAYVEEFSRDEDVRLVLRAYPGSDDATPIEQRLLRHLADLGVAPESAPRIQVIHEPIPERDMPRLYAAADAFVLPTRGEGFGIPFLEAMASGLPTIGTRFSAHLDFMDDDLAYLIDVEEMVPVSAAQTRAIPFYGPDHRWAEPSLEHTRALMRHVFEKRDEACARGARARQAIAKRFSLERTADWIVERALHLVDPGFRPFGSAAEDPGATAPAAGQRLPSFGGGPPPSAEESRNHPAPASPEPLRPTGTPATEGVTGAGARAGVGLPLVVWSAPLLDPSGYADEARAFLRALDAMGVPLHANNLQWSDADAGIPDEDRAWIERLTSVELAVPLLHVQHCFPTTFLASRHAVANVGRTMFETDRIPEPWVAACNAMDEIWIPSRFNLETFSASGVDAAKLRVIPGAVDVERIDRIREGLPIGAEGEFRFLSVFDMTLRKGWDVLLRAFVSEFRLGEGVTLYLRVRSSLGLTQDQMEARVESYLRDTLGVDPASIPDVVLLFEDLRQEQLVRLYRSVDAFVLPSRGEGWCRPAMDALACGLPVITTGWGGVTEYLHERNAFLIDSTLREVAPEAVTEAPAFAGHRWAEPSTDHLRALMRQVVDRREHARAVAEQGRREIVERFGSRRVAREIVERLKSLGGGDR